jgi:CHAT domain-containing protein/tetratricopeptide (TPR) repeat protein
MEGEMMPKHFLAGVGLICLALTGTAQSPTPLRQVQDQVNYLKRLRTEALADGNKLNAARLLDMAARALRSLGSFSADQQAEVAALDSEAADLYLQADQPMAAGLLYIAQGNTEWELGNFEATMAVFVQAERSFEKSNSPCLKIQASLGQARVLMLASALQSDIDRANQILADSTKAGRIGCRMGPMLMNEVDMLARMAKMRSTGEFIETSQQKKKRASVTLRLVRFAAEAFARDGDPNSAGEVLLRLAGNMSSADAAEAIKASIDAGAFLESAGNERGVAMARLEQGGRAGGPEGKRLLDEAAGIFARIADERGLGLVSVSRARLVTRPPDWAKEISEARQHFERSESWEDLAGVLRSKAQSERDGKDLKAAASSLLAESQAWANSSNANNADLASGAAADAARILCSVGDFTGGRAAFRDALAYSSFDYLLTGPPSALMADLQACTQNSITVVKPPAPAPPVILADQAALDDLLTRLTPIDAQLGSAEAKFLSGDLAGIRESATVAVARLDEIDKEILAGRFPGVPMMLTTLHRTRSCRLLGQVYLLMNHIKEAEDAYQCAVRGILAGPVFGDFGLTQELTTGQLSPVGLFWGNTENIENVLSGFQVAIQLSPRLANSYPLRQALEVLMGPRLPEAQDTFLSKLREARKVFMDLGEVLAVGHSWMLEARLLGSQHPDTIIQAARRALELIPEGQLPATRFLASLSLFDAYSSQEDKRNDKTLEAAALSVLIERARWAHGAGALMAPTSPLFSAQVVRAFLLGHLASSPARHLEALGIADWDAAALNWKPGVDTARRSALGPLRKSIADMENRTADHQDHQAERRSLAEAALYFSHRVTQAFNASAVAPRLENRAISSLADRFGPILMLTESGDGDAWGFLLRPGATAVIVRKLSFSSEAVDELLDALSAVGSFDVPSKKLWQSLIAPFWDDIRPLTSLSVVPLGVMSRIPYSALMDENGRYLFQQKPFSVAPSLEFLSKRRSTAESAPARDLTILSGGTVRQLSEQVVHELESLFPESKRIPTADFSGYTTLAPDSGILVMATHGVAEEGPSGTYLQIASTADHDSHLRAFEIAETPLRAELVVLVACDALQGKDSSTSRDVDLASAFLDAGAKAVLAPRWKLEAGAKTDSFLTDFFRVYSKSGNARDAILEARRASISRGDPPLLWAAWELIGIAER